MKPHKKGKPEVGVERLVTKSEAKILGAFFKNPRGIYLSTLPDSSLKFRHKKRRGEWAEDMPEDPQDVLSRLTEFWQ